MILWNRIGFCTFIFLVTNSLSSFIYLCNTKLQCLASSSEKSVMTCFFSVIWNLPLSEMKNKTHFRLLINRKKCADTLAVHVNYKSDSVKTSTERFISETEPSTQPWGSLFRSWSKHHLPLPLLGRMAYHQLYSSIFCHLIKRFLKKGFWISNWVSLVWGVS